MTGWGRVMASSGGTRVGSAWQIRVTTRLALVVLVGSAILAGCAAGAMDTPWPKNAGDTSCADWLNTMVVGQRKSLAQAMLGALWNSEGAAQEPPDDKVLRFANAIGNVCGSSPDEKVASVGAALYVLSSDIKP